MKATITCLGKKVAGFPSMCIYMRFKHDVKVSDRNSQNWAGHRSNATCSHHYSSCLMYRKRCFGRFCINRGDKLGSATDIDRHLVSSGPSTPFFNLIGNDDFWSCHIDLRPKMSPTNGNFEFVGYLGEIESGSQTIWTCTYAILQHGQCMQFSSPPLSAFWLAQLIEYVR